MVGFLLVSLKKEGKTTKGGGSPKEERVVGLLLFRLEVLHFWREAPHPPMEVDESWIHPV